MLSESFKYSLYIVSVPFLKCRQHDREKLITSNNFPTTDPPLNKLTTLLKQDKMIIIKCLNLLSRDF